MQYLIKVRNTVPRDYWSPIGIKSCFDGIPLFLVPHTFTSGRKVKKYFKNHFTFYITISKEEQTEISLHDFVVAL